MLFFEAAWRSNVNFVGQVFGQTEQQKQQHSLQQQRGARAKRARPFIVSVLAAVFVILFDRNLDQKFDQTPDQKLVIASPGCFKKVHF